MKINDTAVMDWIGRRQLTVCLLLALPGVNGYPAVVGVPETWNSATVAGWINYDAVNEQLAPLTVEGASIKVTFRKQTVKAPPEEYICEAGPSASQGAFSGDYVASGVTGMSFRIFCDRQMEVSALLCNDVTKRLWRYRVPAVRTGEWMTVQVPFTPPGIDNVNGINEWGALDEDLRNVTWVGVSIERNSSMSLQVCRLDDVVLQGIPEFGTWMAQFPHPAGYGAGSCVALPGGDLDGDGACNYDEWIAGTSAGDKTNSFRLTIDTTRTGGVNHSSDTGLVLKWPSAPNRKYCIWRSTNLAEGFVKIGDGEIDATPPENSVVDATAINGGPCFYKAEVRRVEPEPLMSAKPLARVTCKR